MTAPPATPARLVDRNDFDQLVGIVAAEVGLLPQWVRKDYWVIRVLDALLRTSGLEKRFVFKGGTSLSKAWKLIDRFSEDIDLLLTGSDYGGVPGKGGREALIKAVRQAVELHTPLRLPIDGLGEQEKKRYYLRSDYNGILRYPLAGGGLATEAGSEEWVLVEMGFRGGPQPMTVVGIQSHIGEYLSQPERKEIAAQYVADVEPINVPVLAPERTFVEKVLAIHTAASGDLERLQARHYYDLAQLFRGHEDVRRCLANGAEFRELLASAIEISNRFFDQDLTIETIDLARSAALAPSGHVLTVLRQRWSAESSLYPKGQPQLEEVLAVIEEVRVQIAAAHP